jgi:ABC-type antimicrobial peptide transport system permease subunit
MKLFYFNLFECPMNSDDFNLKIKYEDDEEIETKIIGVYQTYNNQNNNDKNFEYFRNFLKKEKEKKKKEKKENEKDNKENLNLKEEEYIFEKFGKRGWQCSSCNNFNFESRIKCNRCQEIKNPKTLEQIKKELEEKNLNDKKKKPLIERKGDWQCPKCHNLNFAFRLQCNRCHLSKDIYLSHQNKNQQQNNKFVFINNQNQNLNIVSNMYNCRGKSNNINFINNNFINWSFEQSNYNNNNFYS